LKPCSILCSILCCLAFTAQTSFASQTAASVISELQQLSIDPAQTYRVRELQLARGDIKIYLTEGILAFTKPVAGRVVAAVFTTADTELGDGEVLLLPPNRSERASLAIFAKTPNLDEHFSSAVFFFSDETAKELRSQMDDRPLHPAPGQGQELAAGADKTLRLDSNEIDVKIARSLLDNHTPEQGFFYGIIGGRRLGVFNVIYEPSRPESVLLGHFVPAEKSLQYFQVWCNFRPRRKPPLVDSPQSISDYRLDTVIHPDLWMAAQAKFTYRAAAGDGRAIALELSPHLHVTAAQIDGKPAEFLQHGVDGTQPMQGGAPLLLVAADPLAPETPHNIELSYEGSVVFRTAAGNYFVDERNTWYPFVSPMLTTFDLTFHCPENLRVVATGELLSDDVSSGLRTVHRKTQVPEPLAGFNIGNYEASSLEQGRYRIELFANKLENSAGLSAQAASILDYYTARWQPLGIHSLAISPIEGYFGQGFPGLIYLSSVSYIRQEDRPPDLRNSRLDSFFTEMLLPHEIAHQWWGNTVSPADYRTTWLFEAMSSYSALEFLEQSKGRAALDDVLESYRQDLLATEKGAPVESAGPLDFGERLLDNNGMRAWHIITYEKGAWVLHMLRMRLGDEAFRSLQTRLVSEFQNKLIANDDFRRVAASFVPADQSDKSLDVFFDNWVYATGIPRMAFSSTGNAVSLKVSDVDSGFALDLPLRCTGADGKEQIEWVHAAAGENSFDMSNGNHSCQLPKQTDYLYQLSN
jgi:hypothetical protein